MLKMEDFPFNRVPKVAYLFMTRGLLPFALLWDRFFRGILFFFQFMCTLCRIINSCRRIRHFMVIRYRVRCICYVLLFYGFYCNFTLLIIIGFFNIVKLSFLSNLKHIFGI